MAKSQTLNFTQALKFSANTIVAGDTTTAKILYTGGTNDSVVKAIQITSLDTSARGLNLWANVAGTYYLLGCIPVPAVSGGNTTIAPVDGLSATYMPGLPYDANGKKVLPLQAGATLYANAVATVANTITISVFVEDY